MKQKKRVINFILSVVCCLCVFFGSGMESRAEGPVHGEVNNFKYSFTDYLAHSSSRKNNTSIPVYICVATNGNNYGIMFISREYFTLSGFAASSVYTGNYNGETYYYFNPTGTNSNQSWNIPVNSNISDISGYLNQFKQYFLSLEFNDLMPFIPDFNNYYHEDTDRWLNDLRAEVEDGTLYATWDGLAGEGLHVLEGYKNTYVQFHIQFINDKGTTNIADDEYTELFEFYTELSKNEFSILLSDFEVPEGYRLWCMWAEPYWYFNDDINSTMFKGKLSYLFFDENGVSDRPLIKDTGDIYNPLDPNLSNWNAITNFTGDYFYNMNNVMNSTFNSWDGSAMGSDNDKLGNALAGYSQHEEVIINQVSSNIRNFDFDNYLTFSDKVNAGISFGSMLINKFFVESGDFTILFVVGCIMVFLFVVVGIWRFSK